MLDRDLDEAEE
jgi:hypothetical protein